MKTAFYQRHIDQGAKIVDFGGWEMPIQYRGIIAEHQEVRHRAGLFDVSHMGRIFVEGPDAAQLLDSLSTNTIADRKDLSATYTCWCHPNGGTVDDLIIYRISHDKFFLIVNASNRDKDLEHLKLAAASSDATITPRYSEDSIIALQGPRAQELMGNLFPEAAAMKPMRLLRVKHQGVDVDISTTGYTGEKGYEISGPTDAVIDIWDFFRNEGVHPIGLGARDTLRLEMGYALYGHELSDTIAPNESVSAWTVRTKERTFIGKEALPSYSRHAYGIKLKGKGIARETYNIHLQGERIGTVTSGTLSPTLNQAIALILVDRPLELGSDVDVEIRGKLIPAELVKTPFIK